MLKLNLLSSEKYPQSLPARLKAVQCCAVMVKRCSFSLNIELKLFIIDIFSYLIHSWQWFCWAFFLQSLCWMHCPHYGADISFNVTNFYSSLECDQTRLCWSPRLCPAHVWGSALVELSPTCALHLSTGLFAAIWVNVGSGCGNESVAADVSLTVTDIWHRHVNLTKPDCATPVLS